MKRLIFFLISFMLAGPFSFAQVPAKYFETVGQARSSFKNRQYKSSGMMYASAFKSNGGKAFCEDRYDAARSWAKAGNKDSAFVQLLKVAFLYDFTDYTKLTNEPDFTSLHSDGRWKTVTEVVKSNIGKSDAKLNKAVVTLLDSVYRDHHSYRLKEVSVKNEFGEGSAQLNELRKIIRRTDSINLVIVTGILDKYGWMGRDVAGFIGNYTLALIMEHAALNVQESYLPMIRKAFKDGKIEAYDYALLEDRIALREGRKQNYGSVLVTVGGKNYVAPLEDPDGLSKRRKEIGLNSMGDYLSDWGLSWDPDRYKKDLVFLEKETLSY